MEPAGLIVSFFVAYGVALNAIDILIGIFLLLFTIWWILAIPRRLWIIKELLEEQLKVMKRLASHELPKSPKAIDDNQQEGKRIKVINQSNKPTDDSLKNVNKDKTNVIIFTYLVTLILAIFGFVLTTMIMKEYLESVEKPKTAPLRIKR